jgi:predicted dehydrogenase
MASTERIGFMRGGIVGLGFIAAKGHLPAYRARSGVEIAAVADLSPARRALAASLLPRARVYSSAQDLLTAEEGRLDFLDIATPPSEHAGIALRALEAGLHVLCEKPLATSAAQAAALLARAVRERRVIFPCHNYKHAPVVAAVRGVLESGRIGRVRSVALQTFRTSHARGVPEWNPDWRRQARHAGGGIAMDHGSHTFYLAFEWLGAWPSAVTAKMENQQPERFDTEDNAAATLSFGGGRLAVAHLTWTAGQRKVRYAIQGEHGALAVDDDALEIAAGSGPRLEVERREVGSAWMDASHAGWFGALLDRFFAAVAAGDYAGLDAQDAFRCIETIEGSYRSAAHGCREVALGARLPEGVVGRRPDSAGAVQGPRPFESSR